jgi:hypothetical protein
VELLGRTTSFIDGDDILDEIQEFLTGVRELPRLIVCSQLSYSPT